MESFGVEVETANHGGGKMTTDRRWPPNSSQFSLAKRRLVAWLLELGLITASGIIPWQLGHWANQGEQSVPINPILSETGKAIAQIFGLPKPEKHHPVTPLTNLLWSLAYFTPIVITTWQFYLLAKTGQTLPKRWLQIKIVTAAGTKPGWKRVIQREIIGRYGLTLTLSYTIWRFSGAFPFQPLLWGLVIIIIGVDGLASWWHHYSRTIHDRIGRTLAISAGSHYHSELASIYPYPFYHQSGYQPIGNSALVPLTNSEKSIILPSSNLERKKSLLWQWLEQYPSLSLALVSLFGLLILLLILIRNQIDWKNHVKDQEFSRKEDQLFLALVNKLSTTKVKEDTRSPSQEKQIAIVALGASNDSRSLPLLTDLLMQENDLSVINIIQQALVSNGLKSLPYLKRLNQSLTNDLESTSDRPQPSEQKMIILKQRTVKKSLAKILKIYSSDLQNIDLSKVDLGQIDHNWAHFTLVLDNTDLSGINLRSANLVNASFKDSKFYSAGPDEIFGTYDDAIADLSGADLTRINFTNALLTKIRMNRTNLLKAILNQANLSNSQLEAANFSNAKLIGSNFYQAQLIRAKLIGADLAKANFQEVNLSQGKLSQATAIDTQFQSANLTATIWSGADLSRANFSNTNLSNADLSATKLTNAVLRNANLKDASLRNADLAFVDLQGAKLDGTDLQGAQFLAVKSRRHTQELTNVWTNAKQFMGVNFDKAKNLDRRQIAYICLQGGIYSGCPQK